MESDNPNSDVDQKLDEQFDKLERMAEKIDKVEPIEKREEARKVFENLMIELESKIKSLLQEDS